MWPARLADIYLQSAANEVLGLCSKLIEGREASSISFKHYALFNYQCSSVMNCYMKWLRALHEAKVRKIPV